MPSSTSTIRDVAKLAGVSISTVSLTLNRPEKVGDKTFRKVMAAAEEAGYIANPMAKGLRLGSSPLIGLIVSSIRTSFAELFLAELEQRAFERGYLVSLTDKSNALDNEAKAIDRLLAQRAAGLLVQPTENTSELLFKLQRFGMPVVQFDRCIPHAELDFVGLENRIALSMLTRHLIGLGHARIGLITGTANIWTTAEREIGFRQTMSAGGLVVTDDLVLSGDFTRLGGYHAATRLLVLAKPPTAIIAANNEMMIGTLQAAQELGYAIPERLSICCVDGAPWGEVLRPSITHVSQPVEEMSALAGQWLFERIDVAEGKIPPRQKAFMPTFIQGTSTASPS